MNGDIVQLVTVNERDANKLISVGWRVLHVKETPTYETVGFFRLRGIQTGTKTEFIVGRTRELPNLESTWLIDDYVKKLRGKT